MDKNKKDNYNAVSLSGGKDSTAMLILMIEKGMPIDLVLTADTGMEFPEMYEHLAKVDDYLYRERGIHITTIRHPKGFEWLMFEHPITRKPALGKRNERGIPAFGYGWPSMRIRWCTGQLKTCLINKEVDRLNGKRKVLNYIGIAADETQRCKGEEYPLVEWGITEAQALQICYNHGFNFGGLYEIYHRASCWCCPLQRIDELRNLRHYHPELWVRLMDMDNLAREMFGASLWGQFKKNWSIERLEQRFANDDEKEASEREKNEVTL